jgi:hypothetical protein
MAKSPFCFAQSAMPAVIAVALFASALPSTNARAASEGPEGRALPSAASVEVDTYRAEMTTDGAYKPGAAGSVKIKLTAIRIASKRRPRRKASPIPSRFSSVPTDSSRKKPRSSACPSWPGTQASLLSAEF